MTQAGDFWAQVGGNKSSRGGFYSVFSLSKSGKETALAHDRLSNEDGASRLLAGMPSTLVTDYLWLASGMTTSCRNDLLTDL